MDFLFNQAYKYFILLFFVWRKLNYKPNQTVPALAIEIDSKSSLVQQPIYESPEKSFTDSGVSDNLSEYRCLLLFKSLKEK